MIGQITNPHGGAVVSTGTDHQLRHRAAGQALNDVVWPV